LKNVEKFVQVSNLGRFLQVRKVAPNDTINHYLNCRFVIYYINPLPAHMPQPTNSKQPLLPMFAYVNHKGLTVGQGGQRAPR
jgi:hypothetical protein